MQRGIAQTARPFTPERICHTKSRKSRIALLPGGSDAGIDVGATAADLDDHRPCGDLSRRRRDRLAHRRRPDPPLHLSRCRAARATAGPRAVAARDRARRPDRDARLEHLSPCRALLRDLRHRRGVPHHQPAAVRRADRLHRQPRRRPAAVRRRDLSAIGRAPRPASPARLPDRADDRRRDGARNRIAGAGVLRRAGGGRGRRLRLARVRRAHRRSALLHFRHHGQSEGRALQPSLDRAARVRHFAARRDLDLGRRRGLPGGAAVSRLRLGHPLRRADERGEAGAARAASSTARASTSCSKPKVSPTRSACRPCGSGSRHIWRTAARAARPCAEYYPAVRRCRPRWSKPSPGMGSNCARAGG